jgi:multiple sugar transport system permease protein
MWGFLYSKNFGPIADIFAAFGARGPDFLSTGLIFYGLLNVVTWQWAGYYMIILYAALQGIDPTLYEAARIDGARPWQIYWRVTLPLLRPAMLVASVLNIIYVFNSFPIVYTLNDRNPGFTHDTTITFMYKIAFKSAEKDVGMSAAAGIFNVLLILVVVMVYLKVVKWQETEN